MGIFVLQRKRAEATKVARSELFLYDMTRIVISGIGGVGGYYGGMLAAKYHNSPNVEVCFISRGENLRKIVESGLRLETTKGDLIARPAKISDDPSNVGMADLLIVATKSYDLEENMRQLRPCIGPSTIIMSLLNGVDNLERIKAIYPENEVWGGVVFIVTRLAEPGLIRETGNVARLKFGTPRGITDEQRKFNDIFRGAGIDSEMSDDIESVLWEKFVWISAAATATSYFDHSLGRILENPEEKQALENLLSEIMALAKAKKVRLPENILETTRKSMVVLPYDTTTSMHSDYMAGKNTEVESLTGVPVRLGDKLGVDTPTYDMMYNGLKQRR